MKNTIHCLTTGGTAVDMSKRAYRQLSDSDDSVAKKDVVNDHTLAGWTPSDHVADESGTVDI